MKITKELLLSIILKYFNEKKEMSFYELEKKTGKSVVTPLNAKDVLGLQSGEVEDVDLDSEEAK